VEAEILMIRINWNPLPHLGSLPVNWYGLNWVLAFIVGFIRVRRWSAPVTGTANKSGIVFRLDIAAGSVAARPNLLCSPE